jgi:uncharacterized protein YkwD
MRRAPARIQQIVLGLLGLGLTLLTIAAPKPSIRPPVWQDADYPHFTPESFREYAPANAPIEFQQVNYPLLNAAIFFETNRIRALHDLPSLQHSPALEVAAEMHAHDMVIGNFFSHENPFEPYRKTPALRLAEVGITSGRRAENIADTFGIQYKSGGLLIPPKTGQPDFLYFSTREPIPPHTCNTFAAAVVDEWLHSPGHRDNILDVRFRYLGCGAYHYRRIYFHYMDCFKVVQEFASEVPEALLRPRVPR